MQDCTVPQAAPCPYTEKDSADMEIDEIIASIEGSPSIGNVPFLEGEERIEGSNTESTSRNEETIYYDIRFYILVNEGKTKILFGASI